MYLAYYEDDPGRDVNAAETSRLVVHPKFDYINIILMGTRDPGDTETMKKRVKGGWIIVMMALRKMYFLYYYNWEVNLQ